MDARWYRSPTLLVTLLLLALLALLFVVSIRGTGDRFVYAMDDPYIHIGIARSLAERGVWGVDHGFAAASSSPLWTLLLAGIYLLVGTHTLVPLILNIVAVVGVLYAADTILRFRDFSPLERFFSQLAIILLATLPSLVFVGMEHTLHVALTLLFAHVATRTIIADERSDCDYASPASLPILAFLLTAVRYEGLFLVGLAGLLLAVRKRWGYAVVLVAAALLPVALFGFVSSSMGWFFFPSSVLLKGNMPDLGSWSGVADYTRQFVRGLIRSPQELILLVGCLDLLFLSYMRNGWNWSYSQVVLVLAIGSVLLHEQFAGTHYRYLSYLEALQVVALLVGVREQVRLRVAGRTTLQRIALVAMLPLAFAGAAFKGGYLLAHIPRATMNIDQQQMQMARFVRQYYVGRGVAANDIGALALFGRPRLLDLFGLASLDVGTAKRNGTFTTETIRELARNHDIRIAMVYEGWYQGYGGLPPEWEKVGTWSIPHNVACAVPTVSIYAVDPGERDSLVAHLREFAPTLPRAVRQSGPYMR